MNLLATPPNPFHVAAGLFEQGAAVRAKDWAPSFFQRPQPEGNDDWAVWALLAGRGVGKTDAGAFDIVRHVRGTACLRGATPHRIGIIAPTLGDAATSCWEDPSGISAHDPTARMIGHATGGTVIRWPNGSTAKLFGADHPKAADRLRAGGNLCRVWAEEFAAWAYLEEVWTQVQLACRLGTHQVVITTTPRPKALLKAILAEPTTRRALTEDGRVPTTNDNPHLPEDKRRQLFRDYGGSRLGRQELLGEILDDDPRALWRRSTIDRLRTTSHPDLVRVVVAVDPEATSTEDSAETGIIVVGMGYVAPFGSPGGMGIACHVNLRDRADLLELHPPLAHIHGYVLADATLRGRPEEWGRAAVTAYHGNRADLIVGEVNNGGEMVGYVLRTIPTSPRPPFKAVHASRGKATRAEPISTFYEQDAIHHVGSFGELEEQLCTWVPGEGDSPDRLDALVWGFTELQFESLEVATESGEPEERISPI